MVWTDWFGHGVKEDGVIKVGKMYNASAHLLCRIMIAMKVARVAEGV